MTESRWPGQIWAPWQDNADPMTGMADFNKPKDPRIQYGINQGLPSDWRDTYKETVGRSSAWDVIGTAEVAGNALFAAAADAIGLNWDEWRAETMEALGNEDEYEAEDWRDSARQSSSRSGPPRSGYGRSRYSGDSSARSGSDNRGLSLGVLSGLVGEDDFEEMTEDKGLADLWGLGNQHNQIKKDLNEMEEWLEDVNKKAKERQADIIAGGPQLSDYNLEGDFDNIYEALGLTEAPEAPRELAVTYHGDYKPTISSVAKYHKPSDRYADIQLHDDRDNPLGRDHLQESMNANPTTGNQPGRTPVGTIDENNPASASASASASAPASAPASKFSETQTRWINNVEKIIGEGQDWAAWANVAGVNNLNSRNDSDRIKKVFRENNGVLPTT